MAKYKVSLYVCPAQFPFPFAIHPWFVAEKDQQVNRWGIGHRRHDRSQSWGYLNKNFRPPYQGIPVFPYIDNLFFWTGKLIGSIEGGDGSLAEKVYNFIENSNVAYPYRDRYRLAGPNSNTYVQWVLSHFPELKLKLPRGAIGKNYDPGISSQS